VQLGGLVIQPPHDALVHQQEENMTRVETFILGFGIGIVLGIIAYTVADMIVGRYVY
jgi:heme/copper-type cytochrome/quinol oxidase subunit 4